MRPQPIVLFERLYLISLILGIVSVLLEWQLLRQMAPPVLLSLASALFLAVLVALVLLVSRRRSQIAKWVLVGLTVLTVALSLPSVPASIAAGPPGWLGLLQTLVQLVAVGLLFTAPARDWLGRGADAV